jgi:phosphoglycolate phosphatase
MKPRATTSADALVKPTKLLIFDYDGVLVDSLETVWKIYCDYRETYKMPVLASKDDIRPLFDKNIFETFRGMGISPYRLYRLSREFKRLQLLYKEQLRPFPGMESVISRLAKQPELQLAIISSNDSSIVHWFLRRYKLEKAFHYVLGGDTHRSKIKKIRSLIKRLKMQPQGVYYIGDTIGDIEEGKKAGVHTVAVTWGYHNKAKLVAAQPEQVADTPEALESMLLP